MSVVGKLAAAGQMHMAFRFAPTPSQEKARVLRYSDWIRYMDWRLQPMLTVPRCRDDGRRPAVPEKIVVCRWAWPSAWTETL